MKIINFTHRDLDGAVCSILLRDYFHNTLGKEFICQPCTYKTVNDNFKNLYNKKDAFFITDISLDEPKFADRLESMNNVVMIDHHEREYPSSLKHTYLDQDKGAGCKMVFDYVSQKFGHKYSKEHAALMGLGNDYDTWTHKYTLSKRLNWLFYFYYFDKFVVRFKDGFNGEFSDEEMKYLKFKESDLNDFLKGLSLFEIAPNIVLTTASRDIDEAAQYLQEKKNYMYVFILNPASRTLSIRSSNSGTVHLGKFAMEFDGGGHPHSAGLPAPDDEAVEKIIERFLDHAYGEAEK